MKLKDFRKHRNMPFVKRGMRVIFTHDGRKGRIAGANESSNLNIIFDGERHSVNCHPYFKMQYFDKQGKLIKEYINQ